MDCWPNDCKPRLHKLFIADSARARSGSGARDLIKPCWPSSFGCRVRLKSSSIVFLCAVSTTQHASERDSSSSAAASIANFSLFSETSGKATQINRPEESENTMH